MLLDKTLYIPDLGEVGVDSGFHLLPATEDGRFVAGKNGVEFVVATGDNKVEFISFGTHSLACVKSAIAYPTYYPVYPVKTEYPLDAVLMDLDGTTVRSEDFWARASAPQLSGRCSSQRKMIKQTPSIVAS